MIHPPVFIVGQGNSGTSLLNNILGRNSNVFVAKETWFFVNQEAYRKRFGTPADMAGRKSFVCFMATVLKNRYTNWQQDIEMVANKLHCQTYTDCVRFVEENIEKAHEVPEFHYLFRLVFDYFTQKSGKSKWVESTPVHLFYCGEILHRFPKAIIVNIFRNPLTVVASGKQRSIKRGDSEKWPFEPILRMFAWKKSVKKAMDLEKKYPGQFYSIRYEDLVTTPELTIRRICDWTDIKFEKSMLDIEVVNPADPTNFGKKGFMATRLDKWHEILSPEESTFVNWATMPECQQLGYANLVAMQGSLLKYLKLFLNFLIKAPPIVIGKLQSGRVSSVSDFTKFIKKRVLGI